MDQLSLIAVRAIEADNTSLLQFVCGVKRTVSSLCLEESSGDTLKVITSNILLFPITNAM